MTPLWLEYNVVTCSTTMPHVQSAYSHSKSTQFMMPGTYECPSGWTGEYYLMSAGGKWDEHSKIYICMDKGPESIPGSAADSTHSVLQC